MKIFRALWGQTQSMVQHKIPVARKINNYWDAFKETLKPKNYIFGIFPGPLAIPLSFYWVSWQQYWHDVACIDSVCYDVKLYPDKPVREGLHL